jgi:choline dehydrogenase
MRLMHLIQRKPFRHIVASPMIDSFDFVIVGAGSAGCVLAEKLSANGRYSVCILEAGGSDRRFFVQMPLGYGKTFWDQSINWGYRTEPDDGLAGAKDYWPRGKIIGGSGSLNAMVWIRGDARDFDAWAAEGNPGWAFSDVLPVFKALEHNAAGGNAWRSMGGPMHIADMSRRLHPLAKRFIEAGQQAGFALNADFNAATQEGVGSYQFNINKGWRQSAAKAFLRPALKRKNVQLLTQTLATKILFDGQRASGVEALRGGQAIVIKARHEVILAGGAVNTPQLLQLSGIGPAGHLQSVGVPVLLDSPAVGYHLQDHLGINYIFRSRVPTLNQRLRPLWGQALAGAQFLLFGKGPLSMSLNHAGGFVKARAEDARPNVQLYFQAISTLTAKKGTRPLLRPDPFPGFAIGLSNCRPTARGSIVLRSPDPQAHPAIHANAFGTAHDLDEMLASVKVLRKIAATPLMAAVIAEELAPGPAISSDAALIDDFRRRSGTVYHPCGTARMAPSIDKGVVDARLRVHGIQGLRVADASVFPFVPSGNTNAPTMMVAAKAATMVLEDQKLIVSNPLN